MAQVINDEISAAWRALSGSETEAGWRSISLSVLNGSRLLAARQFPGNAEALLIGFDRVALPAPADLPAGTGFRVERIATGRPGNWLALTRQPLGSLDMFARMAADIVSTLASNASESEQKTFQLFIGRIRAWQQFMSKCSGALGPEAELGLSGELHCLGELINAGLSAHVAVDGWCGPLDGLQDFELGSGAVEVKSTLASSGFPAKIMSLEQLDDNVLQPLFLCGCRFALGESGLTLPERVAQLRLAFADDFAALATFESAILHGGYLDAHSEFYTRSFAIVSTCFLLVDGDFPRLTPGNVSGGIRQARYEIDLDSIVSPEFRLENVIEMIGVG